MVNHADVAPGLLSIIIPCFNDGLLLDEAVSSVGEGHGEPLEIVIVDDGSTDRKTLEVMARLEAIGHRIIHQQNKGPSASRNRGIHESRGEFILLLDADNRIRRNYVAQGLEILRHSPDISVVYGRPVYIGEAPAYPPEPVGDFDLERLIRRNYIDTCALVRRNDFEDVGGFDESLPVQGLEDWALWISLALKGKRFFFLDEVSFEYRIRSNSLVRSMSAEDVQKDIDYLAEKYLPVRLQQKIGRLERELATKEFELECVYRSRSWLVASKLRNIRRLLIGKRH